MKPAPARSSSQVDGQMWIFFKVKPPFASLQREDRFTVRRQQRKVNAEGY